LDAALFHIYGVGRDDVDYVMGTFPIVAEKDKRLHGEYRTKLLILERYDAMARAIASGVAYETVLDPPAAAASLTAGRAGPRAEGNIRTSQKLEGGSAVNRVI
jgi:hypothetical protein